MAIQTALPKDQVAVGMALVIFAQTFGGSLFLTFAQTDFSTGLTESIETLAPNIKAETVIAAGASAVRMVVPSDEIAGVLEAYNRAVQHTFYLATGAAAVTLVFCWGMGWKSVKGAKKVRSEA